MNYRELLELYKQGKLEEQKRKEVEADIEKQDAISDYLYSESEIPGLEFLTNAEKENTIADSGGTGKDTGNRDGKANDTEQLFVRMINQSIRRAFIKMGLIVGTAVLAIMLFVQFLLPSIVSAFYYDPGKRIGEHTNQMSLDMAVYTELLIPGYKSHFVSVESKGYGNYDICVHQSISYNGMFTDLSGKIERNRLTLYNTNFLKLPASNVFEWSGSMWDSSLSLSEQIFEEGRLTEGEGADGNEYPRTVRSAQSLAGTPEEAKKALQKLNDNTKYAAYVTLDKMMEYDAFVQFIDAQEDIYGVWCAPCTNAAGKSFQVGNLGFYYNPGNSTQLEWDQEKYPYLQLWSAAMFEGSDDRDWLGDIKKEDFAATHFISMLRYMSKQKQFCKMMDQTETMFADAADYVEENGLTVYGFAVFAEKEALLRLNGNDEVYVIGTEPLQ